MLEEAAEDEAAGKLEAAVTLYEAVVKQHPAHKAAYNRLMILLRKLKLYKKEAAVIKQAIAGYETAVKTRQASWSAKNAKPARLSKALAKALGMLTPKGLPTSEDEQIATWRKRLAMVKKKL
ncbi:MAG: hypothetical protein EOP49_34505 [Sphingobacteriales bacterium]|nr:MAG: hypothetical protein EOP49_34505 [Sphingobacteriales bacterium]